MVAAARRHTSWCRSGTCGAAGPASWTGCALAALPEGGCAMRKPLLSLAAVAAPRERLQRLRDAGAVPSRPGTRITTSRRRPRAYPAATAPRRRHARGPRHEPVGRPAPGRRVHLRARCRHRVVHDRPALHRRRAAGRIRRASGSRSGSTRSTRAIARPGRHLRDRRRRRPDALHAADEVLLRIGLQARTSPTGRASRRP